MWKGRPQLVPEVVELDWNRATIHMPMSLAAEGRQPTEASYIPMFISEQLAYIHINQRYHIHSSVTVYKIQSSSR